MRKKEEAMRKRNEAVTRKYREAEKALKLKRRNELLQMREAHKEGIIEKNERHMKMDGRIWQDVDKAMLEYDKSRRKEWEEVGITPPSFR
jgi:hypothetical protein